MDERGSEIATTSVFECHLSPVGRLMDIENFVFNFFYLRSSIVLTFSIAAYPAWFRVRFMTLRWTFLHTTELNDDITFFSVYPIAAPSPLRGSDCNTLSHSGLANFDIRKRMFYPLIKTPPRSERGGL